MISSLLSLHLSKKGVECLEKKIIITIFAWIFSVTQAGEPVSIEEMPEIFYLAVWRNLWETHKENDLIPLTSDDSPLVITTYVPLHTGKRQAQSYLHRLYETSYFPCIVLKVKKDALQARNDTPHTFSKDHFGHYRLNATIIPTRAIIGAEIIPKNI